MFKALVIMCVIGIPNNCITLEDQYGPYETEFECKQRALAISRQVHKHYPMWRPDKWKCKKLPIGRLVYGKNK
jgi:hypothetical protein|tara:strand:+ start:27 stop:245 length:219 start_codon:yes stop_codon:yes gene_type:complete